MRGNSKAGRGKDIEVPDIMWRRLHLSGVTGEQLKCFQQEVARSKWYWGKIKTANITAFVYWVLF